MPGVGFIEMSPNLALTIASSIIGGKGHAASMETLPHPNRGRFD
jgi:hypothetical protein